LHEAINECRLLEVTHELAQATGRIEAMALVKVNAPVAGAADFKKEVAYLEGKVRAVEGQIYLIKNRLGADLVKLGNVEVCTRTQLRHVPALLLIGRHHPSFLGRMGVTYMVELWIACLVQSRSVPCGLVTVVAKE